MRIGICGDIDQLNKKGLTERSSFFYAAGVPKGISFGHKPPPYIQNNVVAQ